MTTGLFPPKTQLRERNLQPESSALAKDGLHTIQIRVAESCGLLITKIFVESDPFDRKRADGRNRERTDSKIERPVTLITSGSAQMGTQ